MLYKDTKTTRDWLVHEMEHGFLDHQREILRGGTHCAPGRVAAPSPPKFRESILSCLFTCVSTRTGHCVWLRKILGKCVTHCPPFLHLREDYFVLSNAFPVLVRCSETFVLVSGIRSKCKLTPKCLVTVGVGIQNLPPFWMLRAHGAVKRVKVWRRRKCCASVAISITRMAGRRPARTTHVCRRRTSLHVQLATWRAAWLRICRGACTSWHLTGRIGTSGRSAGHTMLARSRRTFMAWVLCNRATHEVLPLKITPYEIGLIS